MLAAASAPEVWPNLSDPAQVMAALLRYNNSMPYAQNVLGWAAGYATGSSLG